MLTSWWRQALTVCAKDLRTEYRQRTATTALLLFAVTALVVVGFALSGAGMSDAVASALLWIVLFFAAFSGLAHVFTEEEEGGTALALCVSAWPESVYAGKLAFNLLLVGIVAIVASPAWAVVVGLRAVSLFPLLLVVVCGSLALGASATIVGAIVAKARVRGALFGALGFPIVLPLLVMAVVATQHAISPGVAGWSVVRDAGGLLSYAVMMVAASVIVFPVVWET